MKSLYQVRCSLIKDVLLKIPIFSNNDCLCDGYCCFWSLSVLLHLLYFLLWLWRHCGWCCWCLFRWSNDGNDGGGTVRNCLIIISLITAINSMSNTKPWQIISEHSLWRLNIYFFAYGNNSVLWLPEKAKFEESKGNGYVGVGITKLCLICWLVGAGPAEIEITQNGIKSN